MKILASLLLPLALSVVACGDDGGPSIDAPKTPGDGKLVDAKPIDARPIDGGPIDSPAAATVTTVTCPATVAATVTTAGFAYSPAATTVHVNDIVKFVMPNGSNHDVNPGPGPSDPGLVVGFNTTACLKFGGTGTFQFFCSIHNFTGTITVN